MRYVLNRDPKDEMALGLLAKMEGAAKPVSNSRAQRQNLNRVWPLRDEFFAIGGWLSAGYYLLYSANNIITIFDQCGL